MTRITFDHLVGKANLEGGARICLPNPSGTNPRLRPGIAQQENNNNKIINKSPFSLHIKVREHGFIQFLKITLQRYERFRFNRVKKVSKGPFQAVAKKANIPRKRNETV